MTKYIFLFSLLSLLALGCKQTNNQEAPKNTTEQVVSGVHSPGQKEIPAKEHGRNVNMLTLIVTNNYVQHPDDTMELFSYHLYGEIFVLPRDNVAHATLTPMNEPDKLLKPSLDYRSYYFEGGYFKDMQAVYEAYPDREFTFNMTYADSTKHTHNLPLPEAQEPPPTRMFVYQDGKEISPLEIDPTKDTAIKWSDFSDGKDDANGIINDLVTIVAFPCKEGKRAYMSGVPNMNAKHLTFKDKEALIPAGTLKDGEWYWLNGEFSNVAYTSMVDNAPAYTSYMTATYLAIRTKGGSETSPCEVFLTKVE